MGMFLSKYSMLRALAYDDDNSEVKQETLKLLEPYKLFGLVLHDPLRHHLFHGKLEELFPRLDYLTGKHFLFFALTNPPDNWKKKNNRNYFGIWESFLLLNPQNAYDTVDEGISAFTIAKTLGIGFDNLPCILLATSFASKYFVVVPTSEYLIEKQMTEIGYFCEGIPDKNFLFNDKPFQSLLSKLHWDSKSEIKKVETSIASLLSDFLSFVATSDADGPDRKISSEERDRILRTFQQSKGISSQNETEFEEKCLALMGSIAHLKYTPKRPDISTTSKFQIENVYPEALAPMEILEDRFYIEQINWEDSLENESKIIYQTLLQVISILDSMGLNIDYSPFAIGYFKIFEKEMNLSVVHAVRKFLKIEMPNYFNKVKPNFDDAVITPEFKNQRETRRINFNIENNRRWLPPGLGESEIVIRFLLERKKMSIERLETVQDELMRHWRELRIIRNKAAHPDPLSKEEFKKTKTTFESLVDSGIFLKTLTLKKHYKGVLP